MTPLRWSHPRPAIQQLNPQVNLPGESYGPAASGIVSELRAQLHLVVAALVAYEGSADATVLLAVLRVSVDRAEPLLAAVEPDALAAIHAGLAHAAAEEYRESCTELLAAYRRLSTLLLRHGR